MIMAIIFLLYVAHKEEWNTVIIIVIIVSYKLVWYVFFNNARIIIYKEISIIYNYF